MFELMYIQAATNAWMMFQNVVFFACVSVLGVSAWVSIGGGWKLGVASLITLSIPVSLILLFLSMSIHHDLETLHASIQQLSRTR
ncbi:MULTISPECIES: hypothetical protein [Alicyclobacillus]|uniref:Uncharacterized protein n=1 Tax=Alicyclobacillus mali (ex Roth et al. 2021) TaxID=1123961 RepID=A0ABS0F5B0_9BACL|nr:MULTISPECIES: hypothetical protein [Alicyclobacillus]MBF8378490.1 hypothetical protein [Alicyclobacillus mali (ex Roth et al. 2021)]